MFVLWMIYNPVFCEGVWGIVWNRIEAIQVSTFLSCPRLMNGAVEIYKLKFVTVIQTNDRIELLVDNKKFHHSGVCTTRDM